MGIFDSFQKKGKREYLPLMYYQKDAPIGKFAKEADFPILLARNMILYAKRLHYMGVYDENNIVTFSIPGMLEMLESWDALHHVKVNAFDTAQIAFGDLFAGCWYENHETTPPMLFLIPQQFSFYHSKKERNYYLCLIQDGLDLCQNRVSDSNEELKLKRIGKGEPVTLGFTEMTELKTAFHILYIYLKYKILIRAEKEGYQDYIRALADDFCKSENQSAFIADAKQYFSLNTEKIAYSPLAFEDVTFGHFLDQLLSMHQAGIATGMHSFASYLAWFKAYCGVRLPDEDFADTFELLLRVNEALRKKGRALYLFRPHPDFSRNTLLVGPLSRRSGDIADIETIPFGEALRSRYANDIEHERKVRQSAKEWYKWIGVEDTAELLRNIRGDAVLDQELYDRDYVVRIDADDDLYDMASDFFAKHGLRGVLNRYRTQKMEGLSAREQMRAYVPEILISEKCLVCMEYDTDSYVYAIIQNEASVKAGFCQAVQSLMELREIFSYEIWDGTGDAIPRKI